MQTDTLTTKDAFERVRDQLLTERVNGHWVGQLSASALSIATATSALSFYLEAMPSISEAREIKRQIENGVRWVISQQNGDGGWGDTDLSFSNISTTMLVVAALTAAGRSNEFELEIAKAESYIESKGGIAGLRKRYGKDKTFAVPILANCAMAGIVPWKEVSALPFEAACVPQKFYHLMQLPVVSYAIPALVSIGQAKFANDPPWNPIQKMIRSAAINKSLQVLQKMQPTTGGFLEAAPLTSFVAMGLIKSGKADHPVVQNCVRFLVDSYRVEVTNKAGEEQGSWPIDTNLATWVTTLSINSLANHPTELRCDGFDWTSCVEWLLKCQNTDVHPFTGAAPGGWGWTDLSGAVPDADDTPGALIALYYLDQHVDFDDSTKARIREAVEAGLDWLVNLQNRDHGWPTFCRGWGKLPFDRSGLDITAHAIRALHIWQTEYGMPKIRKAIATGLDYLGKNQLSNGSWLPLWFGNQNMPDDVNPCYGTAKVLAAYRDTSSFDTRQAEIGLRYLCFSQNEDGGWGGGASVQWDDARLGSSSVEETALCTELLLDHEDETSAAAAQRGVEWLIRAVETGNVNVPTPIGFYFAKLWYHERLYPLIFATGALAKAQKKNLLKT